MSISLATLPSRTGRRSKRVGRGNSSGRGTYSGRGLKGQRSRSGGRRGIRQRALKGMVLQIPKRDAFRSPNARPTSVTLADLERTFADGAVVSHRTLVRKGLAEARVPVKILATGKLTKKLTMKGLKTSEAAKTAITGAGGTIE